ncbi:UDP-N-acetylglucosamine diphosphorylase/glucosamine-1-phosphate N-acetyltransferase [Anseongella ginsenosidimutans]|uniref:UDP-N-acetylglucosamine diphosphorylase/glucosamine-1-phosphate N-acetyltransferase n=1 Tax=Anseongella ginsenosidimutans TaxID=496056 RepID=A0A4R3KN88_9SPHI|nr:putative sugar nucleotidyl transferase [Anseongella ginsenosidimutans]QEC52704.1 glucose-1-phosphate thymidylyltransferase [Anseongella ginsenosidimutans]TCS85452.1 UDP-N-acetylglucosamine diphosphorylase/glucosamine-1-phosphate N-acetyltransferase [Anseongella ginsenosidimutans]
MNYILFDGNARSALLPFTRTRPVAEIRAGILTIREKWERFLGASCSCLTAAYLREKFPFSLSAENILINASLLPDTALAKRVASLKPGQTLMQKGAVLAAWLGEKEARSLAQAGYGWQSGPGLQHAQDDANERSLSGERRAEAADKRARAIEEWAEATVQRAGAVEEWTGPLHRLIHPEDIFRFNAEAIAADFDLLTAGKRSAIPGSTNRILGHRLFLEADVEMECANINTLTGPVYIGKGAVVMEGVNLRGPLAIGAGAVVKMGARLYGPTTIGPESVVGGEIKQSVIFGNTNKSHDGYLGNSVIGEWCNLGADTNCSNMKNNYKSVKLWSYETGGMRDTGLPYCGLMMGDFSRTGINTMFNTGTTVGVNVNLYGSAMPPAFLPDFSWGSGDALQTYRPEKALETAKRIMEHKGGYFTEADARIHHEIFNLTEMYRKGASE